MAPNPIPHLLLFLIPFLFLFLSQTSSLPHFKPAFPHPQRNQQTVYEILPQYGLPSGLLPDSVTGYTLSSDGEFAVLLPNPCYVQFDEYLVYYDRTIKGKLKYGSITDLEGIQVQKLFFWLDVDEINVDLPPTDSIYFHVGFINKKLDLDQFKTVHSCRDKVTGSCGYSWKRIIEAVATFLRSPFTSGLPFCSSQSFDLSQPSRVFFIPEMEVQKPDMLQLSSQLVWMKWRC